MEQMHKRLLQELPIDRIEVCCHIQTEDCTCRKPKPGMLLKAAHECGIDLKNSFMVGDRATDVEAGLAVGCTTIFIDLDYAGEKRPESFSHRARSIAEAADIILHDQ
jgi:D-glycero-D-manno-heptose 1,7-bisphosphate phosphatase